MCARDAERACETPGAIAAQTLVDARDGLDGAHEHGMSPALAMRDDVEAVVHPVDQKHVRVAGLAEERACSLRETDARVAGGVVRSAIRLGLDDARDFFLPAMIDDETRADESAREHERVTFEKRARKR